MRSLWLTPTLVIALASPLHAQGGQVGVRLLRVGTLHRDRTVDVPVLLPAGAVLHVRVDQHDLDVALGVTDAAGADVQRANLFSGNYVEGHAEQLVVRAPHDGDYVVHVSAAGTAAGSPYRLTGAIVPSGQQADALVDGFRLLAEGLRLVRVPSPKDAIAALDAAATRLASAGAPDLEAKALQVAGGIRFQTGDVGGARAVLERSLPIARRAGSIHESDALEILARVHLVANDFQQALDVGRQAVAVSRQLGLPLHQAAKVNTLAMTYRDAGQPERALSYLTPALEALDDRHGAARAQLQITAGGIHSRLGDAASALPLLTAAATWYRQAGDPRFEAIALGGLGIAYLQLDRNAEAMVALDASSRLERTLGNAIGLAHDAANAAEARRRLGRLDEAARLVSDALEIGRAAGDRPLELTALMRAAMVDRDRGRHDEALAHVESAVALSLAARDGLRTPAARAGYLSSRAEFLELRTDVLMDLHAQRPDDAFAVRALAAINDTKARGLAEMVGDPAPRTPSSRERDLEGEINRLARERASIGTADVPQAAALGRRISDLLVELEAVRAPLDRPPALPERVTFDVAAIRALLDNDTVLLQYGYGRDRVYGWIVTPQRVAAFTVGERRSVDERTRRAHELLATRGESARGETTNRREQRLAAVDRELDTLLSDLGKALVGPVRADIDGRRVAVVAEGVLQYLPFAALMGGGAATAPGDAGPEIVHLPSIAVLDALRARRGTRAAPQRALAVFADPVFSNADTRVRRGAATASRPALSDVTRAAEEAGIAELGRLRFSRREADAIEAIASGGATLKAVDFTASVGTLREAASGRYRILHFATHGLVNHVHPELSGLVFSLVDSLGRPQEGFLRLHEIYGLQFQTELVTLSACRTAFGRVLRGEGLAGLSQGFLAAGASRVLASLWDVDDRATAELMTRFYTALLVEERPAADALRRAQAALRRDPRWRSPYYWAGFILQGDWR